MSNQILKAAIIDDGVHPDRFPLKGNWIVEENLDICPRQDLASEEGHADICMSIIQKYAETKYTLWHSIKVLQDDTKRGYIGKLLKALEFCESLGVKLIHLSIGSTHYEDFEPITIIIERLLKKEIIVIAATSNDGIVTYPAYIPDVISVKCDPRLKGDEYVIHNDPIEQITFRASSQHRVKFDNQNVDLPVCNSFAAPLITAKVITHLNRNPELNNQDVLRLLTSVITNNSIGKFQDEIDFDNSENSESPDIPVVILSGFEPSCLLRLIKELNACLKADDYNVRIALDHPLAVYLDMTPVNTGMYLSEYVRKMCAYFNCEIALLGFSSSIPPEMCPEASLWIWGTDQDYQVPEDQVGLTVKNESGQEVYEKMLSILL